MDDIANHMLKAIDKIQDFRTPDASICDKNADTWVIGPILQQKILEVLLSDSFIHYILNLDYKLNCYECR